MQLKISNKELNHLMIDKLNGLFTSNIGDIPVQFIVYDHLDGVEVSLPSKSIRIKPNPILYKELSAMDIEFKLN